MISAVVFDLDGTVLDNEGDWEEAFKSVIDNGKNSISDLTIENSGNKDCVHTPGIGITANWKRLMPEADEQEIAKLSAKVRQYYQDNFADNLRVMDGFVPLVEKCQEMQLPLALATASNWDVVEDELEELNLYLAFEITTTGDEVLAHKPDPEIYLLSAQKLGIDPENCLVVEDSLAGVESGTAAGCQVVGLISDYASEEQLKKAGAKWTVTDLGEIIDILNADEQQNLRTHAGPNLG